MATYVSQYSTTGFYRAPVSKGLMGALFITCTAINVPLMSHLRMYLICQLPNAFTSGEVWRLFTSQAAFLETKDLICGALLIYYFRIFERRLGSKKFASYLLATSLSSLMLQVPVILLIRSTGWGSYHHHGHLPPGPYGLIFPLFVPYLCDIPRVTRTHILGIPVTGKTLTYLVGLQVCSTSFPTTVAALCSIAAGLFYRWNVLKIQDWLVIPEWLARATNLTFGRLLASSPPADGPMGATLEIQRQEQMERLEQQMLLQRSRDIPRQNTGQGYAERLIGPEMQWGEPGANGHPRHRRGNDFPNFFNPNEARPNDRAPSEENVTFLTSMGFSRDRVVRALQTTGNNVEAATNLLLQE